MMIGFTVGSFAAFRKWPNKNLGWFSFMLAWLALIVWLVAEDLQREPPRGVGIAIVWGIAIGPGMALFAPLGAWLAYRMFTPPK